MKATDLKMEGITELSQEELVNIVGGDAYRAGQLIGYGVGFVVGGVFTVFSRLMK